MTRHPWSLNRAALLAVAVMTVTLFTTRTANAQTYWFEDYERAVSLIDSGRMAEASVILNQVIQEHPLPLASVKVPGDRFIAYVPHFHLARIQVQQGDTKSASLNLDICEAFGNLDQNRHVKKQVLALRQQISQMRTSKITSAATGATTAHVDTP